MDEDKKITLPDNLRGRSIHQKVIPTVCNLENMLNKLIEVEGNYSELKNWEQRSYNAYKIDDIKYEILNTGPENWKEIIKEHIINSDPDELGASCIDIYLVAYVSENHEKGRQNFCQYVKDKGISDKENSAQAIWQVGKGDGVFLDVLNDDGTVRNWDFFASWLNKDLHDKLGENQLPGKLKEEIKDIACGVDGVDVMGITSVKRLNSLSDERHPDKLLENVESIIVLGSQMFKTVTDKLTVNNKVGQVSFQDIYKAQKDIVDSNLQQIGYRIARLLANKGYQSLNISKNLTDQRKVSGAFSFKSAAVTAGLGVIGKNGLLINPTYGSRLRLSIVLTTAVIEEDPVMKTDPCKDCSICIKACPSGAIKEPGEDEKVNIDRFVCSSFYNANGGCSICVSKCTH